MRGSRSWLWAVLRKAKAAAVGVALFVSLGLTGLVTMATTSSPAQAATSSTAAAPTGQENLNPDCQQLADSYGINDEAVEGFWALSTRTASSRSPVTP